MARTEKDYSNDIKGFSLMTAYMTFDTIMMYGFDGEETLDVPMSDSGLVDMFGNSFGKVEQRDGGLAGKELFEKWVEGMQAVCDKFEVGGLAQQPEQRRNEVGELVSAIATMTATTFHASRHLSPIGVMAAWLTGIDEVMCGFLPNETQASRWVRDKLKEAIEYGMEQAKDDPLLPAAMQAGFIQVKPLDPYDMGDRSSLILPN